MSARDDFEGVASGLGHGGDARVSTPRGVIYVPGAFPGERVKLRAEGGKRGSARLLEVLEPSPARRAPPCPIADRCGGCALMGLAEGEASRQKRQMLARAAGIDVARWYDSPRPLRYRRRARLRFDATRAQVGYRAKRSHALVPVDSCMVLTEGLDASLTFVESALAALGGKGDLSISETLDGVSLCFDSDRDEPPSAYRALETLAARDEVSSVALRVPGSPVPSVFGRATERHEGPDGLPLETPLGGFVQANAPINARLSELVAEWADVSERRVVELFSGSGNLTVLLAGAASSLVAVEGHTEAVSLAASNLAARGLAARLVAEDAEHAALPPADVLVLDPPRRGFPGIGRALAAVRPERVVLVSCDLGSLGRELGALRRAGYEVDEVAGFDMFPQTPHLEALVRLTAK
jgi:23S rRNA (uracil1939-C5)-methyltransferase